MTQRSSLRRWTCTAAARSCDTSTSSRSQLVCSSSISSAPAFPILCLQLRSAVCTSCYSLHPCGMCGCMFYEPAKQYPAGALNSRLPTKTAWRRSGSSIRAARHSQLCARTVCWPVQPSPMSNASAVSAKHAQRTFAEKETHIGGEVNASNACWSFCQSTSAGVLPLSERKQPAICLPNLSGTFSHLIAQSFDIASDSAIRMKADVSS